MANSADICIYGDSLMKGAIPVALTRYQFIIGKYLDKILERLPLNILNRARFGAPVTKGASMLEQDLARNITAKYTLLEYGGNDCNFDWSAISANPAGTHLPKTDLETFTNTLSSMTDALVKAGSQPVLMTLPPIDAEKYLDHICSAGCSRENILTWLGDTNMIYRFQELYSDAIGTLAVRKGLPLVNVRPLFLDKHNYKQLISPDGIHPSELGYDIMYSALSQRLEALENAG